MRCSLGGEGALGRYERLGENLPTEYTPVWLPLAVTGEDVFTRSRTGVGQIQCGEKSGQWVTHAL